MTLEEGFPSDDEMMRVGVVNLRSRRSPSLQADGNPKLRKETRSKNSGHPEEREKEKVPPCVREDRASELGSQESPFSLSLAWPSVTCRVGRRTQDLGLPS